MNCKSCNTRMPAGLRTCPNCGRLASSPAPSAAREEDSRYPLVESRGPDDVDIELEEIEELEDVVEEPGSSRSGDSGAAASSSSSPAPARSKRAPAGRAAKSGKAAGSRSAGAKARKAKRGAASPGGGASSGSGSASQSVMAGVTPSIDDIRELVTEQPDALEAGLRLYAEDGHTPGAPYSTDVGDIDVLAIDDAGGLVAMAIVSGEDAVAKQIVGEMLQRVGWLSRHVASEGQEVRAIVLVDTLPQEVEYAAAAVGDAIEFKTWRVSVSFDSIDL